MALSTSLGSGRRRTLPLKVPFSRLSQLGTVFLGIAAASALPKSRSRLDSFQPTTSFTRTWYEGTSTFRPATTKQDGARCPGAALGLLEVTPELPLQYTVHEPGLLFLS